MLPPIADLENLLRKAIGATHDRAAPIDIREDIRPPRLISRAAFADVVSQLFHAERATSRMCRMMAGQTRTPTSDVLLQFQAGDERHHGELYESYLQRLGDIRPIDPRIEEALEAMLATTLGPEAVLAAYNIVLEGEAVKLQQDCIERFTCPGLTRITRAIGQDEARHVAFGHAYLPNAFNAMDQEKRFLIYRHIRECWRVAALPPSDRQSLFATILTRKRSDYMSARWAYHHASLRRVGLIRQDECPPD